MKKGTIEVVKGNAIDYALENPDTAFFHVVNCQGKMQSGVAKEVKDRVPGAYEAYKVDRLMLGTYTQYKNFFNLAAQDRYGREKRHLNYGALSQCFYDLSYTPDLDGYDTIVVPYKMGSDRAGGSWSIVVEMLEYYFPEHYLIACKL